MKNTLFLGTLLLATGAVAQPATSASPDGAGAGGRNTDPNQMVCRSIRETGSMLSRTRICKTRAQWEAERRDTRQSIDRAQSGRRGPSGN